MLFGLLMWTSLALADGGDVQATARLELPAEAITDALADFGEWERMFPEDCLRKVAVGVPSAGEGARARLTYTPGPMRRRLTAVVKVVEPGRRIDVDHEGNKGFITRFTVTPAADGAHNVSAHTYINEPPWPFRAMYRNKVVPAWQGCYETALGALGRRSSAKGD